MPARGEKITCSICWDGWLWKDREALDFVCPNCGGTEFIKDKDLEDN